MAEEKTRPVGAVIFNARSVDQIQADLRNQGFDDKLFAVWLPGTSPAWIWYYDRATAVERARNEASSRGYAYVFEMAAKMTRSIPPVITDFY